MLFSGLNPGQKPQKAIVSGRCIVVCFFGFVNAAISVEHTGHRIERALQISDSFHAKYFRLFFINPIDAKFPRFIRTIS